MYHNVISDSYSAAFSGGYSVASSSSSSPSSLSSASSNFCLLIAQDDKDRIMFAYICNRISHDSWHVSLLNCNSASSARYNTENIIVVEAVKYSLKR